MGAFIDEYRAVHGVEPISAGCPPIAPSTYHARVARRADPARAPPRGRRDAELSRRIRRAFEENSGVYGVRKVWRQLGGREGIKVARCTVARLMREVGLQGVARGRATKRATVGNEAAPRPPDRVNRNFGAKGPDALRVAAFTCVATRAGFVHAGFVHAGFAGRIVGWRVAHGAQTGFVLDALEQALHGRRPIDGDLVHPSDRGVQYVSIAYTERPAEAGIEPSVGSVGDSFDDAPAEAAIGLFKAEVIRRPGPWRSLEAVEWAALAWVDWFTHRRPLEPLGNIPPAGAEARSYATLEATALAA